MRALQHRGHALDAQSGIDRGSRQVDALAVGQLLVLHEHEIPDFNEAIALGFRGSGRAAPDVVAVIVENLRTRTARSGVAHRPEIVATGNPQDLLLRQARDLPP